LLESIAVRPDDCILEVGFGAGKDIALVSALAIHRFVAVIDRIELKSQSMNPVSIVCILGIKKIDEQYSVNESSIRQHYMKK
jgi:protein-L-isoaspartate O-methyltransferase